jgi:SAM-dependent methyltransferase
VLQTLRRKVRKLRSRYPAPEGLFRLLNGAKPAYECPICGYSGPFQDKLGEIRKINSRCPRCGSTERTRAEWVVLEPLLRADQRVIHFAPERLLSPMIRARVASYETADLSGAGVDHKADLRALPFADGSFDLAIASHVLEHIKEDRQAISEIRRILSPKGVAVLPVPTHDHATLEYDAPNPAESGHVRRPGVDYYDRYGDCFSSVVVRDSAEFSDRYHLDSETREGRGGRTTVPVCRV